MRLRLGAGELFETVESASELACVPVCFNVPDGERVLEEPLGEAAEESAGTPRCFSFRVSLASRSDPNVRPDAESSRSVTQLSGSTEEWMRSRDGLRV